MNRDKIVGMFLGVGIGDALGMPVECYKRERIIEQYAGRIDKYETPTGTKYFDGKAAGDTTDDTQLTLAVAEALIETGTFDMDLMAKHHVRCLDEDVGGWGSSTKEAIQRLKEGMSWKGSGVTDKPKRGYGNGICMKVAPLAAYLQVTKPNPYKKAIRNIADLAMMTHCTSMAISSGLAHTIACGHCLGTPADKFDVIRFATVVVTGSNWGKDFKPSTQTGPDDLTERLKKLERYQDYTPEKCVEEFGGGSYYVYDSLPFSYMFFCRNPRSIESLYDVVSWGGDTDSNGSMVGALLGALNGMSIFPTHLIEGLKTRRKILDVANRFCDRFGIK